MNSKALLAVAALALVASTGARADRDDPAYGTQQFQSTRTRDEVRAEAMWAAHHPVPDQDVRVAPQPKSTLQRSAVSAEAAQALRMGRLTTGDAPQF